MARQRKENPTVWNDLSEITKFGIVIFVVISTFAGYALGFQIEQTFSIPHLLATTVGTALLSAGSFVLNQIQEQKLDAKMPRTEGRPLPSGRVSTPQAWFLTILLLVAGTALLYFVKPLSAGLGLITVFLYNVCYTLYWKKRWVFGAVPGAIPGAMPVVIGYSANNSQIFSTECIYAFLIMFLWQMPHYWALAIKFKDDYQKAEIPTLPVSLGTHQTLFHMGLYVFAYVGLALFSPWFVDTRYVYLLLVVPFALKVLWEYFKFEKAKAEQKWLSFFMWTNVSMLIFLIAPVIDKWHMVYFNIVS
ncbi:MAG: heme o synthase [Bdellovibrionales bacterium]